MSELEPVWCVRESDGTWHGTVSGNAPISYRKDVRCLCPRHIRGEDYSYSGGNFHYLAERRLPDCFLCVGILKRRRAWAEPKGANKPDVKQGELF